MIESLPGLGLAVGSFALLFAAFSHADGGPYPLRRTLISASLGWGVAVVVITEALSALGAISEGGALVAWTAFDAALLVVNARLGWPRPSPDAVRLMWLDRTVRALVLGCALIAATTLVIALAAPPNNWDAMTYHLGRVIHWVENGNVGFYPALYLPQLYQGPWAEYALLNLVLLGQGGDHLVNLLQWSTYIGCALVSSLVAAQLGAGRLGQALAALVVITLPMAILQSSSAQNHLVVSFWLLCFASLVLFSRERVDLRTTIEAGVCLGLAILTKGSAYVLVPPFVLWAAVVLIRRLRWVAVGHAALAGGIAVGLNATHWARNLAVFGSPLGPRTETGWFLNSAFTPKTFLESAIQETTLHIGTPFHGLNVRISEAVQGVASVFHLDLNDPATTWPGATWSVPNMTTHEDYAGNLLALLLIAAVVVIVLWRHRGARLRYVAALGGAFALFVALLRWTPYQSRIELPLFIIAAPIVGAIIGGWRRSFVVTVSVILLAGSLPWVLVGKDRPLLWTTSVLTTDRTAQYFANRPDLEKPYEAAAAAVARAGCRDVGINVQNDDPWEYPLWRLLNPGGQDVTLRDIEVTNESGRLETGPPPCMIVFVRAGFGSPEAYRGVDYVPVLSAPPVYLYERSSR